VVRAIPQKPYAAVAAAGELPGDVRPAHARQERSRRFGAAGLAAATRWRRREEGPICNPHAPSAASRRPTARRSTSPSSHTAEAQARFNTQPCSQKHSPAATPGTPAAQRRCQAAPRIAGLALAQVQQNFHQSRWSKCSAPRKPGGDQPAAVSWPSGRHAARGRPSKPGAKAGPTFTPKLPSADGAASARMLT